MDKFPRDASRARVVAALEALRFQIVREREHIAMIRQNADGTKTPLTLPNHKTIKSSTLRTIGHVANMPHRPVVKCGDFHHVTFREKSKVPTGL